VIHFGYAEADTYARLLRQADLVISTAIHEFFGVAVVEAIYAGCFPILPDRLSYPELLPERFHGDCLYDDFADLVNRLRWALMHPDVIRVVSGALRVAMKRFSWQRLSASYDRELPSL
jgi:glycosyltransferase involved in cell wall biosynthesis